MGKQFYYRTIYRGFVCRKKEGEEMVVYYADMPGHENPVPVNPSRSSVPFGAESGMPIFIEGELSPDGKVFRFASGAFPENPEIRRLSVIPGSDRFVDAEKREAACFAYSKANIAGGDLRNWHLRGELARHFKCRANEIPEETVSALARRVDRGRQEEIRNALSGVQRPTRTAMLNAARKCFEKIDLR